MSRQLNLFGEEPEESQEDPGLSRRTAHGSRLPVVDRRPMVIHVLHQGFREAAPTPKMVGKLVPHPTYGLVFYHAQSGSQRHRNTDCPAPTDTCLIRFLEALAVDFLYAYDREEGTLYRAKRLQVLGGKIEIQGNRKRHYLPEVYWQKVTGLDERQEGRRRVLVDAGGEIVFVVPYLKEPIVELAEEMF